MFDLLPLRRAVVGLIAFGALHASPLVASERPGEADTRRELQRHGQQLLDIRSDFLDFGEIAKKEAQFNLFYVAKQAEVVFLNIYHVRTILDLALVASSPADEGMIRLVLAREANDTLRAIDDAIASTQRTKPDFSRLDYLKRLGELLAVLQKLRPVVERMTEKKT